MMLESDGPGGAEILALRLSEELRNRGHHVVPVGGEPRVRWLSEEYRRAGFTPETVSTAGWINISGMRKLGHVLRSNRIDVAHSHEFEMAVRGALIARLCRVRHIITIHGPHWVTQAATRRIGLRAAFAMSAAAVMVSEDTRRVMSERLGIPAENMQVVPNGVPVPIGNRSPTRDELGIARDELIVIAVGSLDVHKGHIFLLEAIHDLLAEDPGLKVRIVLAAGRGGAERDALERFARESGLTPRLSILSYRNDVADLLAAADVFVMPSLWEGMPLALLEAMLAGKPVIATSVGGIPEAIEHDVTGLLCPPCNSPALARALGAVLRDAALRDRLGRAAKETAMRRYTLRAMADSYESLYLGSANAATRTKQVG
jgi:glycosyltransferase involved in cell wall biosynthesis